MTSDPIADLIEQADALDRTGRSREVAALLERALPIDPDARIDRFRPDRPGEGRSVLSRMVEAIARGEALKTS